MKTKRPTDHLAEWLSDKRVAAYLGRAAQIRLDILAMSRTGQGTLADIARRHKVSRAAVAKQLRRAEKFFA